MVEFFNQTFMNLEQSQTGLLPFANIMYKPSNKFSVTAKYRAYPRYPDIGQLSTFTTQVDTLTWSVGNPELKPSNYQEIGLDFNILNKFTISPVYSFDSHNYQQYLWEENGKYYQSQVNANYKSLGVNVSFRLPITKTLFWQNWSQLRDTWLSYNGIDNNRTTFLLNSTLVYSMPKWNAVAGVGIQKMVTKYATLQGYNTGGNDIPMLMLQKSFFKNKLNCTFVFVPPIKEGWLKYSQENLTQIPGYYSINSAGLGLLQNMMLLQINYHFNSGKQIKVKKSSLDNDSNTQQKSGGLGL